MGGGHRRGRGGGWATWEREGKSNTLGFLIIAFFFSSFFFFKSIQMFFLLKLDGFTFTAGVDAGKMHFLQFLKEKSYHLMRGPPAGPAALLQLKLA